MTLETDMFKAWYNENAGRLAGEKNPDICQEYRKQTKSAAPNKQLSRLIPAHATGWTEFLARHPRPDIANGQGYGLHAEYLARAHGEWGGKPFTAELVHITPTKVTYVNLKVGAFPMCNFTS